jgi:hypothetical protein
VPRPGRWIQVRLLGEMALYAVTWRDQTGVVRSGRLELGSRGFRLESGSRLRGRVSVLSILYRDVQKVDMAASAARVGGRPTVALTMKNGALAIAPTGAGLGREVLGLLQSGCRVERQRAGAE